jgi:4-alpha-glucanotransferase
MTDLPRACGVLLHPTSLPGPFGIGDLGSEAYAMCRTLVDAGQTYWQILPLGPTGYGDSPYQCFSAFAGNTLLISPEKLLADGLIAESELDQAPGFGDGRVDYGGVFEWKSRLLEKAFDSFASQSGHPLRKDFDNFKSSNTGWLEDYSLYRALKQYHGQRPWYEWHTDVRLREESSLARAQQELAALIEAERFYQFLFFRQWKELKAHANGLGLKIIGDVPIFVALDSADVWRHQDKFKLNADGSPKVVAGVPPDYFSSTGQLWGNPIYDWDVMRSDGFEWWISRLRAALAQVDVIRLDHFRGFAGVWEVPGGDETAEHGSWVDVPGKDLFGAVKSALGDLPVIAEDLGVMTEEVEQLRDANGFPGMRILQYAFGGDHNNRDLPHNYVRHSVVYTGTHDNDTSVGWFHSQSEAVRNHCLQYLDCDEGDVHWGMIRAALSSIADTAIIPVQDLLGLGNEGRMNLPATTGENWSWRLNSPIDPSITARLAELSRLYGRSH